MNRRTRGQIAEMIEDALIAQGFKDKTAPLIWAGKLFGWMFEKNVPMERMSRRQAQNVYVWLIPMTPFVLVALLLALPFEWLRARRATDHNARTRPLLLGGGQGSHFGGAAPGIEGRAAIDYRIEIEGRAVFVGTALVAYSDDRRELLGFTVHRGAPPRDALDGQALASALSKPGAAAPELCHWQWNRNDPYEVVERPSRPW